MRTRFMNRCRSSILSDGITEYIVVRRVDFIDAISHLIAVRTREVSRHLTVGSPVHKYAIVGVIGMSSYVEPPRVNVIVVSVDTCSVSRNIGNVEVSIVPISIYLYAFICSLCVIVYTDIRKDIIRAYRDEASLTRVHSDVYHRGLGGIGSTKYSCGKAFCTAIR